MKKNFLTVMIYAAIFSIFFTCGAFAETTQPPSVNIDSELVGTWGYGINNTSTYYNYYSGDLVSINGTAEIIDFLADGTFTAFFALIGGTGGKKVFFIYHKGDYKVENDIIYLTNVMRKGQYYLDNVLQTNKPGDTFDWRLLPDQRLKYFFNEDYTSYIYEGVPLRLTNLDTEDTGLPKDYLVFQKYMWAIE